MITIDKKIVDMEVVKDAPTDSEPNIEKQGVDLIERPPTLHGSTYKIKPPGSHAYYLTINNIEHDGTTRPFEIFLASRTCESTPWIKALMRMISAVFRHGGDLGFVVEELKQIQAVSGYFSGRFYPSVLAHIGFILEDHMRECGYLTGDAKTPNVTDEKGTGQQCAKCHQYSVVMMDGCLTCTSCGDSKCG